MGGGKRINQVEDVLDLGDDIEVRVDDVDPQGKVSLSPVTPLGGGEGGDAPSGDRDDRPPRRERSDAPSASASVQKSCRSRIRSTPSCVRSSAISARPRPLLRATEVAIVAVVAAAVVADVVAIVAVVAAVAVADRRRRR